MNGWMDSYTHMYIYTEHRCVTLPSLLLTIYCSVKCGSVTSKAASSYVSCSSGGLVGAASCVCKDVLVCGQIDSMCFLAIVSGRKSIFESFQYLFSRRERAIQSIDTIYTLLIKK